MQLYFIRHAKAVERSFDILEDYRYLTPEGRERFRTTASLLRKKGLMPESIVSSPLVRAVQTAEILAETLSFNGLLTVDEALSPGYDLNGLRKILARHPGVQSLACVGHEPDLSDLGCLLLGTPGAFTLAKGGVLAIEWDSEHPDSQARFLWLQIKGKFYSDFQGMTVD